MGWRSNGNSADALQIINNVFDGCGRDCASLDGKVLFKQNEIRRACLTHNDCCNYTIIF